MKKIFASVILVFALCVSASYVLAPVQTYAQDGGGSVNQDQPDGGGSVNQKKSEEVQINLKVDNPIGKIDSIDSLIAQLIKIALLIGVPILVLAFIWIGFLFVKAQGKPDDIKKAKGFLQWAIIGAFLLLGASVLAEAIRGTVDQLR